MAYMLVTIVTSNGIVYIDYSNIVYTIVYTIYRYSAISVGNEILHTIHGKYRM